MITKKDLLDALKKAGLSGLPTIMYDQFLIVFHNLPDDDLTAWNNLKDSATTTYDSDGMFEDSKPITATEFDRWLNRHKFDSDIGEKFVKDFKGRCV